jgi:hypothetical protein
METQRRSGQRLLSTARRRRQHKAGDRRLSIKIFKQTVRKRGFGVLPAISIGTGALIARSEPRPG